MTYTDLDYASPQILAMEEMKKQRAIPHAVGRKKARAVHFQLPGSFLMVKQVVPQGKCIREKIMTHRAVTQVQP